MSVKRGGRASEQPLCPFDLNEIIMQEPAVAISDFVLTIQSVAFAIFLLRRSERRGFVLFFCSEAAGTLFGGFFHGFFDNEASLAHTVSWLLVLMSVNVCGLAAWFIGASFVHNQQAAAWLKRIGIAQFLLNCIVLFFVTQDYSVAVANYTVPFAILALILLGRYIQDRNISAMIGLIGIVISFFAGYVEIASVPPLAAYFDRGTLYHVILFFGNALFFVSALPEMFKSNSRASSSIGSAAQGEVADSLDPVS